MKKYLCLFIASLFIFCQTSFSTPITTYAAGPNYYYVSNSGNDNNDGLSPSTPWKTLAKVGTRSYLPGEKILLNRGNVWNEKLTISNSSGNASANILISSYGTGNQPQIRRNMATSDVCVVINDASYFKVEDLNIGYAAIGLQFRYNDTYGHSGIVVDNCYFHDIYGIKQFEPSAAFPGVLFSTAILIGGKIITQQPYGGYVFVNGIAISNSTTYDAGSLLGSQVETSLVLHQNEIYQKNTNISGCVMTYNGIYGVVIGGDGGTMSNCTFLYNGSRQINVGSAAIMLGNLWNYTVTGCEVAYQQRQGADPDGCGIDFEMNCHNITITDCNIHNNAGVGVMFYDNGRGIWNSECTIDNNTFNHNNQNPGTPGGYEIYFDKPGNNLNGTITNNDDYWMDNINFLSSYDPSVTVYGNTCFTNPSYTASSGFKAINGANNWFYKKWSSSTGYTPMYFDVANSRWSDGTGNGVFIANNWQHPGYTYDSVRAFKVPFTGPITITAPVSYVGGGSGVIVSIKQNSTTWWSATLTNSTVVYPSGVINKYVTAGDMIYFVVNCNGSNVNDSTNWDPVITYQQ